MVTKHSDIALFIEHWDVEPVPGMALEILDKSDYDVYDCVVTRTDEKGIWIKRDDRETEELADINCLQTPGEEDEDEDEDDLYDEFDVDTNGGFATDTWDD